MLSPKLKGKINKILKDKKLWALIAILGIGAYLRLWHIDSLLNFFEEYDEATLSLQARFIAEGFLPYKDFTLVQPPFYYLVLASIYKIFGYSLFYAKYLSISLSLASIVLIYLTGKKLRHTGSALVAAGLFAVSPDMVYIGRRVEQEALGVFLIILAIYFIAHFIIDQRRKALIISGLALGLALSVKYTFSAAAFAILLALVIYLMGSRFREELRELARPYFLMVYILVTAFISIIIFFICWTFDLPVSVPWLDSRDLSSGSLLLAIGICIFTLFLTLSILKKQVSLREWWRELGVVMRRREVWYLASGILLGFMAVTGYFLIRVPHEFFSQTVLIQGNRATDFPSFSNMVTGALNSFQYLKIAPITGLLSLPIALVILNRKNIPRVDYFIAIAIIIAFLFCQFFGGVPRYYYPIYPFLLLAIASFVPGDAGLTSADIKTLAMDTRLRLLGITSLVAVFLVTSIAVVVNDQGYDYMKTRGAYNELYAYEKAIDYLESVSPNKVFAANPIFIALSSHLTCNLDVDTFALLKLKEETSEQLIQDNIDRGADYFVFDYWARRIFAGEIYDELEKAISRHARLVQTIGTGSINYVEIYELVPDGVTILNGDFSEWASGEFTPVPSGWQQVLLVGDGDDGDIAAISKTDVDGRQCVQLEVEENGLPDGKREITFCRIHQAIPFPANLLYIDIMPTFNTGVNNEKDTPKSGIVFVSDEHALTISFSDAIDTEQFTMSEDGKSAKVIKPADLGQWSEETIDLAFYWAQAGWERPYEVDVSFFVSIHLTNPGTYDLYIADISEQQ